MAKYEETIGDRLEATRKGEKLNQSEFCEILGIGRTSYSYYTRGERDVPVSVLSSLFEKYNIDPLWLIYGEHSDQSMRRKSVIRSKKFERLALPWKIARRNVALN